MGSPLAPVLAHLFMGYYEEKWLQEYPDISPVYYKRYVDDIISVFKNEGESLKFFEYLNNRHKNIKFTMEKQRNNKISFLDVYLDNSDGLTTTVFRKKTFTGVLTNFLSYTSFKYKKGLVQCLVERAFKINNTWLGFHNDLFEIKNILVKNSYPISLIDKIIRDKT